jgi:dienelactone hydrolase
LAELGYVAFAVDIYGKGVRPENTEQAASEASKYKNDRELLRQRAAAGLEQLRSYEELVEPENVAAIGYCFGGMTVLEMARAGLDLPVAVSFHGSLTPDEGVQTLSPIETEIIVLHGADDPHAPRDTVTGLMKELDEAHATYSIVLYSDAVHSFTEKEAGDDPSNGVAYDERADQRSWEYMTMVFDQTIGLPAADKAGS